MPDVRGQTLADEEGPRMTIEEQQQVEVASVIQALETVEEIHDLLRRHAVSGSPPSAPWALRDTQSSPGPEPDGRTHRRPPRPRSPRLHHRASSVRRSGHRHDRDRISSLVADVFVWGTDRAAGV